LVARRRISGAPLPDRLERFRERDHLGRWTIIPCDTIKPGELDMPLVPGFSVHVNVTISHPPE
jgi:hypothetical protein